MADPEELKAIEQKIDAGEELSKEEEKALMGAPESEEEEEIDPSKKIITAEGEEEELEAEEEIDTEDKPSEKGAKTAEAKNEADDAAKQAERRKQIELEAEKPADQVNVEDYSQSERALFFELKKERRKRQEAQTEADTLKFQKAKEDERRRIEREKAEAETETDPFEGKEDDDILTVAEMRNALKLAKKPAKVPIQEKAEDFAEADRQTNLMRERLWLYEAKEKHPDAVEVSSYADLLLKGDKEAEAEVADVVRRGGNAVLAIYNLVKTHPRFHEIEAKIKAKSGKPAEATAKAKAEAEAKTNKERAERIENNKAKPKTTGSSGGAAAQAGEYTIQELLDMDDKEFARLPKHQRERILQKF